MQKTWWNMEDLEYATGKKRKWLIDNILKVKSYRKELDKFAHYPINNNDSYRFIASKMHEFLEDNFKKIFG